MLQVQIPSSIIISRKRFFSDARKLCCGMQNTSSVALYGGKCNVNAISAWGEEKRWIYQASKTNNFEACCPVVVKSLSFGDSQSSVFEIKPITFCYSFKFFASTPRHHIVEHLNSVCYYDTCLLRLKRIN